MNTIAQRNWYIAAAERRGELSKLPNLPALAMDALSKRQHGVLRLQPALLVLRPALLVQQHALLLRQYALLLLQHALLLLRHALLLLQHALLLLQHARLQLRHALPKRSDENWMELLFSQDNDSSNQCLSRMIKLSTSVVDYIGFHCYSYYII